MGSVTTSTKTTKGKKAKTIKTPELVTVHPLLGAKAPDFSLLDKDNTSCSLTSFSEDFLVLFFYPKDNTPGCTLEAQEFSGTEKAFAKLSAKVIGISGGDAKTKKKFCEKAKISVLLLSDSDFAVAKQYQIFGDKKFMGRTYQGIFRTTFILNKKREIVQVFQNVKPEGHAEEVLAWIKELT